MNDYLKNPSKQKNYADIKDTYHSELIQTRSRLCVSGLYTKKKITPQKTNRSSNLSFSCSEQ